MGTHMIASENYRGAVILVDDNPSIKYEKNGILKRLSNLVLIPILNALPPTSQRHIRRSHKIADEIILSAATHKAVEHLYDAASSHVPESLVERLAQKVWFHLNNAKAIRNRLRLVTHILHREVEHILDQQDAINLLSIASGSARAVLEGLPIGRLHKNCRIRFLDKSAEAIEYSKKLAMPYNGICDIGWIQDTANSFPNYYDQPANIDIIEMVGLLDYFDDPQMIKTLRTILSNLKAGGSLVTANIRDNKERPFVTDVIGWKMIYRSARQMIDLASRAGFRPENITAYYEPLGIHGVFLMKK